MFLGSSSSGEEVLLVPSLELSLVLNLVRTAAAVATIAARKLVEVAHAGLRN